VRTMGNAPILICATPKCGHTIRAHPERKVGGVKSTPCAMMICPCKGFVLGGVDNGTVQRNLFLTEKKD
jgi:hypothetical protein